MYNDEKLMQQALELAEKGRGFTSPNPVVGSIIVKDGEIISQAYHEKYGKLHAEALAIRKAGDNTKDATIYVTLEPCSHHGKTPPCTDAIIKAGIKKVVIGCLDPNPKVNGTGVKKLQEAGIEVIIGILEKECQQINRGFFKQIQTKRPWITLKLALTTDGYLADSQGKSKWITSSEARNYVHEQRKVHDAILVGLGTAFQDDPSLLPVDQSGYIPYRIVIDESLSLPYNSQIVNDKYRNRTIVVTCVKGRENKKEELRKRKITVIETSDDDFGWVNLEKAFEQLADFGINSIYCEGGGYIAGSLVKAGLVDELQIFIAPKIIGEGTFGFAGMMKTIDDAIELEWFDMQKLGPDILLKGKLK